MASTSEGDCLQRAEANWVLAQQLANEGEFNWAIVLVFYSAVHLTNILMVRAGRFSDDTDHPTREAFLTDNYYAIASAYAALKGKSVRCRYEPQYAADRDSYDRAVKTLSRVRDYVDRVVAGLIPGVGKSRP